MRMGFEISRLSILDSTRETYETPDFNSNLTIDISGLRFRDYQYRDFKKGQESWKPPIPGFTENTLRIFDPFLFFIFRDYQYRDFRKRTRILKTPNPGIYRKYYQNIRPFSLLHTWEWIFEISRLSILDSTRETYETPDFNSNLTIDISGLRFRQNDQYRDFRKKDKNLENL